LWNLAFHDHSRFAVDGSKDEQWNRGAYLVQGLAHCGTCHTPRGMAFEEVDVSGRSNLYLSGSEFDGTSIAGLADENLALMVCRIFCCNILSGMTAHCASIHAQKRPSAS
jgi:hypothetical protein